MGERVFRLTSENPERLESGLSETPQASAEQEEQALNQTNPSKQSK